MEEDIRKALDVLKKGGIILYPTDTIPGIGCMATDDTAVARLFSLKCRPSSKSMISLVDSLQMLEKYVESIPQKALEEIQRCETPLTVIYDSPRNLSSLLLAADGSAAFRIPNNGYTKCLIELLGVPLVSTSANFSGAPAPTTIDEVDNDIISAVDYVCDFKFSRGSASASRIIKVTDNNNLTVIRE